MANPLGQNEIVMFLLDAGHGAREICKDFDNTALMVAAEYKNEENFWTYVSQYSQTIFCTNDQGKTALIEPLSRGMSEIIQTLINMDALSHSK
ncbi:hypothetical protein HDU90_000694 [Geranomyces variabilis]|nr:hypothetical protein HDU90_000694 [Geranomyces variabilis]